MVDLARRHGHHPPTTLTDRTPAMTDRLKLYRFPGYGPVYRAWSRWLHRHNRCLLTARGPMEPDGRWLWRCDWCGNGVVRQAQSRSVVGDGAA